MWKNQGRLFVKHVKNSNDHRHIVVIRGVGELTGNSVRLGTCSGMRFWI